MSKSAGNAIPLSATPAAIRSAVHAMLADPAHLRVNDPGRVEGNGINFSRCDEVGPSGPDPAGFGQTVYGYSGRRQ